MKRFSIPLSYMNTPSFQEFMCDHLTGGLTIPCQEDGFLQY